MAVQIASGKIVYVSQPEPGSVQDITAIRNSSLVEDLAQDDLILADKGYQGHGRCITPFKGASISATQKLYNETHASVRQIGMLLVGVDLH